jgi:hypothetical protein
MQANALGALKEKYELSKWSTGKCKQEGRTKCRRYIFEKAKAERNAIGFWEKCLSYDWFRGKSEQSFWSQGSYDTLKLPCSNIDSKTFCTDKFATQRKWNIFLLTMHADF